MEEAGGGADAQRLKRIAADCYDYELDPRWTEYWSNVLVPPHMAARSDVLQHFKHKFYRRFIDPDLDVEPMSLNSTSQSGSTSTSGESSSTQATENLRPRSSGPSTGTSAPPPGRNANSLQMYRQIVHFFFNTWALLVAVLGILPVIPSKISSRAYHMSFFGTMCSSLHSLYTLHGKPRAWNLSAIQAWFQSIIVTKDFIHLLYGLTFVSSQLHLKFALIPVFCWALEHVAKFLRRNITHSSLYRKYLEQLCLLVETNTTTLTILSSHAEIATGFLLIISLFSWQRNIIQTFMYWQLLKLMYNVPATAAYHQCVWARISRTIIPYINRYAPFLNIPITAVQRWWLR